MKITLEELLTTYWSQVTLILAVLGYFLKRVFDAIAKKREINHNLFQEKRLTAVNNFFESYAEVEEMWNEISYFDVLERRLSSKEVDKIVFPSIRKMRKCVLELQIYFNDKQMVFFEKINKNMLAINGGLSKEYFDPDPDKKIIEKTNNFLERKEIKLRENESLINEISKIVKQSFK